MRPYSMPLWTIFVKWPLPAGRLERSDHLVDGGCRRGAKRAQLLRPARIDVVGDDLVPALQEALHHVAAHLPEPQHRKLHPRTSVKGAHATRARAMRLPVRVG